jgi:hypothetical protein
MMTKSPARKTKLAAALKANLKKRKDQAKQRQPTTPFTPPHWGGDAPKRQRRGGEDETQ